MGNSWKPRFYELGHESKMRLLKTHSHTSGRRGYEANKESQEKVKTNRKGEKMSRQGILSSPENANYGYSRVPSKWVSALSRTKIREHPKTQFCDHE